MYSNMQKNTRKRNSGITQREETTLPNSDFDQHIFAVRSLKGLSLITLHICLKSSFFLPLIILWHTSHSFRPVHGFKSSKGSKSSNGNKNLNVIYFWYMDKMTKVRYFWRFHFLFFSPWDPHRVKIWSNHGHWQVLRSCLTL